MVLGVDCGTFVLSCIPRLLLVFSSVAQAELDLMIFLSWLPGAPHLGFSQVAFVGCCSTGICLMFLSWLDRDDRFGAGAPEFNCTPHIAYIINKPLECRCWLWLLGPGSVYGLTLPFRVILEVLTSITRQEQERRDDWGWERKKNWFCLQIPRIAYVENTKELTTIKNLI